MMNQLQKSVCALAVLAATTVPALAVDLQVSGTINPAACTPTLSGAVDYGAILPDTLSETEYTALGQRNVNLAITCTAPAKVAIAATNMRSGSAAADTAESGYNNAVASPVDLLGYRLAAVGLGLNGEEKIGGYTVAIDLASATADGSSVLLTRSLGTAEPGDTWTANAATGVYPIIHTSAQRVFMSWGDSAGVPLAADTFAATLNVEAYINKTSALDISKPVTLDGLTTIDLFYL